MLDHLVDFLFKGVFGDKTVNHDIFLLADTIGAVGGLGFDGRIPPQIIVDDVAGGGKIQASASCFE